MIASPEADFRFVIYRDSIKSFKNVPYLPRTGFSLNKELKSAVYRSASFVNKEKGLMATAPILLGELDFFDLEGNYLSSSIFCPIKSLEKDLRTAGINSADFDPKFHIVQIHANDKYIIALNYNNYQSSLLRNSNHSNQSVLVFDWQGHPIKKFILDKQYFIKSFAVDWRNNRFYGYCSDKPDYPIISYELEYGFIN